MSSHALQHVIANFIRLPDANRGTELEGFLDGFDLTPKERVQARALAADYDVGKFGRIMGSVREEKVTRLLKISRAYLPDEALKVIWKDFFEPAVTKVAFNQLPQAFLEFLIENEEAKRVLREQAPPFIADVLKFELAQAQFQMKHFRHVKKVPEGSRLKHADFVVLSLDHDVQGLRAKLLREKHEPGTLAPEPRPVSLLFLRKPGTFECRVFEIDTTIKQYLEGELESPPKGSPRPESYASLVELGVCHA